jgi:seryl-tRNA synthetase
MEVRFSPPNLKRIGYPKNTIYMTDETNHNQGKSESSFAKITSKKSPENLSDRVFEDLKDIGYGANYKEKDVKEFIQKLNKKLISLKNIPGKSERILKFKDYVEIQNMFGSRLTGEENENK